MGADPRLVSFAFKSALVACLAVAVVCYLLTAGITPAAGSASRVGIAGDESLEGQPASENEGTADDLCPLSTMYPEKVRRWCDLIMRAADTYDLPPELIAAVVLQESGGEPRAYSHSGAVGLMQIMPRDGLAASFMCANGPCFANRPTIAELQDPEYNLEYGARMLAGLLERTGDLRAALKAYGPMDVGYTYAEAVLAIFETYR
jgi:soluble lytic murein transglycosylase-like protein